MRPKFESLNAGSAADQSAVADWRAELATEEQAQIYHLVHVTLKDTDDLYIVDANHDVTYLGQTYLKFPFQFSGASVSSDGTIDSATLDVANVTRDLMVEIEAYDGMRKSQTAIKTISAKFTDDLYTYVEGVVDRGIFDAIETYNEFDKTLHTGYDRVFIGGSWELLVEPTVYVQPNPDAVAVDIAVEDFFVITNYTANDKAIQFTLAPVINVDTKLPRRRYVADTCYWKFRGIECGYAGGLTTCDKTLGSSDGCTGRANTRRFGGFPGVNRTRRVIL